MSRSQSTRAATAAGSQAEAPAGLANPAPEGQLPLLDATLGVRLCAQRDDIHRRALLHFVQLYEAGGRLLPSLSLSAVQHEAHSLKGAAASLGLARLQHQAARIEAQCKAARMPTATELTQLDDTLSASCRAARAHLAGTSQPAAAFSPPLPASRR